MRRRARRVDCSGASSPSGTGGSGLVGQSPACRASSHHAPTRSRPELHRRRARRRTARADDRVAHLARSARCIGSSVGRDVAPGARRSSAPTSRATATPIIVPNAWSMGIVEGRERRRHRRVTEFLEQRGAASVDRGDAVGMRRRRRRGARCGSRCAAGRGRRRPRRVYGRTGGGAVYGSPGPGPATASSTAGGVAHRPRRARTRG